MFISNWLSSILGVLTFALSKGPGVDNCSDTTVVKLSGFFGVQATEKVFGVWATEGVFGVWTTVEVFRVWATKEDFGVDKTFANFKAANWGFWLTSCNPGQYIQLL